MIKHKPFKSHGLLLLFFLIANDVWPAILVYSNCSTLNPHAQDVSSTLVLACLLTDGVQLLLEVRNAHCLLFDFHLVLAMDNFHELLCFVLLAHFSLSPSSLAARFEDVDATTLGCCIKRHWVSLQLNNTTID